MKILYINQFYAPHVAGGSGITLRELVLGVKHNGHEPIVLVTGPDKGIKEDKVEGVKVFRAGIENIYWHYRKDRASKLQRAIWHARDSYNLAMASIVSRVMHAEKPDIVSLHALPGWSAAVWAAIAKTRTPMIQVLHDLYHICPNTQMFSVESACIGQCAKCKLLRLPHQRMSKAVDAVVGVSKFVLNRHLENGYFDNVPIQEVIHNSRDLGHLTLSEKSQSERPFTFGYIGTLSKAKGIDLLLETFNKFGGENIALKIAGTGQKQYEDLLSGKFPDERIKFLGYMKPEKFFPQIDVLIVPSLWPEALGMVVVEAFRYGVPVIAARRGGIPEMISDKNNGYLFDPEQPETLTKAIANFLTNPGIVNDMRRQAFTSSEPFVDIPGWISKYENIYDLLYKKKNNLK
ncbi:MAG: glycosyltransferase family 4 protein [Oxalobacteraceae bacterium]|nr:glycosyltransferase family 4 protein [Oxalobacteraceae bacterium]